MKVLIIKIWALGEVVLTTECLRILKSNPEVESITYLTGTSAYPLLKHNPCIDEVITIDESAFLKPQPFKLIQLIKRIRDRKFDRCLILHHDRKFIRFTKLLGAEKTLGINRDAEGEILDYRIEMDETTHQAYEYSEVASLLNGSELTNLSGLEIYYSDRNKRNIEKLTENSDYILISPSGGVNPKTYMPQKRMPAELLFPVVNYLSGIDEPVFSAGNKREKKTGDLIEKISTGRIKSLMGKTNLGELSALIDNAKLLISNDSLPVHIASALNTPTIAVFGPTNPIRYSPYKNPLSKVIRPVVDCAPCYKDGYIKDCKDMKCWNSINPFDIIEMIKDLGKYE